MLINIYKNTFTATSRLVFDETTGYHSLTSLTHKMNKHRATKVCI